MIHIKFTNHDKKKYNIIYLKYKIRFGYSLHHWVHKFFIIWTSITQYGCTKQ